MNKKQKNVAVSIDTGEAYRLFLSKRNKEEPKPSTDIQRVIVMAISNVQDCVNFVSAEQSECFDTLEYARKELAWLLGPDPEVFVSAVTNRNKKSY